MDIQSWLTMPVCSLRQVYNSIIATQISGEEICMIKVFAIGPILDQGFFPGINITLRENGCRTFIVVQALFNNESFYITIIEDWFPNCFKWFSPRDMEYNNYAKCFASCI